MQTVLDLCLKHGEENQAEKIVSIHLKVSEFSDLQPEWMQRYFNHLSKGTMAEEAKLKIEKMPLVMQCNECGEEFRIFLSDKTPHCPDCLSKKYHYVSGKGYFLENLEVI